jgi:pimeloyl-ACP methyl ester carboxylesterase
LFFAQRSFIYFPTPVIEHPYSENSYNFDSATVKVIVVNKENKNAILYFGGNGEAVEYNAPNFIKMFPNQTIYLVKYRGYGRSTGEPSEERLYSDALNIFDSLKEKHSEVSVIGRSLGSGIATLVASKRSVKKLALITPYDSIESLAQKSFPIFPMSILLKDKYNSIGRANLIKAQTLLLVAENDTVIKKSHSDNLDWAFTANNSTMVVIKNAGHNTISNSKQYAYLLSDFIRE